MYIQYKKTERLRLLERNLNKDLSPKRHSGEALGYDLYLALEDELILAPGEIKKLPSGIHLKITSFHDLEDWKRENSITLGAFIYPRSSTKLMVLTNSIGVIDPDYEKEMMFSVRNVSQGDIILYPGERYFQLLFMPVALPVLYEENFEENDSRGGFGSTGA